MPPGPWLLFTRWKRSSTNEGSHCWREGPWEPLAWQRRGVQPPYGRQGRVPCLGGREPSRGVGAGSRPCGGHSPGAEGHGPSLTLRSSGWRPCRQEPAPPVTEAKHLGLTAGCVAGNEGRALSAAEEGPPLTDLQAAGGSGGMTVWPGGPEGRCVGGAGWGVQPSLGSRGQSCGSRHREEWREALAGEVGIMNH